MTRCKCKTASGKRCSRDADEYSNYCWQHKQCKNPIPSAVDELTDQFQRVAIRDDSIDISGIKFEFVRDTHQILNRHTYTDLSIRGEYGNYIRVGSIAEGSCLFHSILFSMDYPGYRQSTERKQRQMVKEIRREISESITVDDYILMDFGSTATKDIFQLIVQIYEDCDLENRFSRIEPSVVSDIDEFKRGLIDNVIEHCPYEMDNDIIDVMIQFAFENFQVSLSDCGTWAGRGEMALISNHLRVNIYSYGDDRGKAYLIDMYKIMTNDRWSVIRIFNIKQIHYEPIGRLLNGKYYFTT